VLLGHNRRTDIVISIRLYEGRQVSVEVLKDRFLYKYVLQLFESGLRFGSPFEDQSRPFGYTLVQTLRHIS
jgi:hypothetical protein